MFGFVRILTKIVIYLFRVKMPSIDLAGITRNALHIFCFSGISICTWPGKAYRLHRRHYLLGILRPLRMLFGQIPPVPSRQLLQVQFWVGPWGNVDSLEIALPQHLKDVIAGAFARVLRGKVRIDLYFACALQIVAQAIFSDAVVYDPGLIGETRFEMPPDQRQHVILRFHYCKVAAAFDLLKSDKAFHSVRLAANFARELFDFDVTGKLYVGFDLVFGRHLVSNVSIDRRCDIGFTGQIRLKYLTSPTRTQALF